MIESPPVTIVTGASSGIGHGVASYLAERGWRVVTVSRRTPSAASGAVPGDALHCRTDLAEEGAAESVAAFVRERCGYLNGVVNCAGLARFGPVSHAPLEHLDQMFAVNVRAPAALVRAVLPMLMESLGSIVNVTSIGGVLAMPDRSYYGATKAAINSMTRSWAREFAPSVRVNAVLPGAVDTPMYEDLGLAADQVNDLRTSMVESTPMQRFGQPHDVAPWVAALLDPDRSGWVTGSLMTIDGGRSA